MEPQIIHPQPRPSVPLPPTAPPASADTASPSLSTPPGSALPVSPNPPKNLPVTTPAPGAVVAPSQAVPTLLSAPAPSTASTPTPPALNQPPTAPAMPELEVEAGKHGTKPKLDLRHLNQRQQVVIAIFIVALLAVLAAGGYWLIHRRQLAKGPSVVTLGGNNLPGTTTQSSPSTPSSNGAAPPVTAPSTTSGTGGSATGSSPAQNDSFLNGLVLVLNSRNYDGLSPYLAATVTLTFAGGSPNTMSKQDVINFVKQNSNFIQGNWNFSLDAATLNKYKNGPYGSEFANDTYFGQTSGGQFLAALKTGGTINNIFFAADSSQLTQ